jgi:hypothetical protein
MPEARRREVYERSQGWSVPRNGWFAFYLCDDEFNSSVHSDEDAETKKPVFPRM